MGGRSLRMERWMQSLTVNEKGGIYVCLVLWYASASPYASDDAREVRGERNRSRYR